MSISVLILYDAKGRSIGSMARAAADGVEQSRRAVPILKTIDDASRDDLLAADGLNPRFPQLERHHRLFQQWLDDQGDLWEELALEGRPGAAFTTGTGAAFRSRDHPAAVDSLDAGLRDDDCRASLVGADADLRLLLRRHCRRRASPPTTWHRRGNWERGWPDSPLA